MDSALAGAAQPGLGVPERPASCPAGSGNRHPSIAPYETFRAADGDFAVAVGNDAIFARLCAAIGRPELAERSALRDERGAAGATARSSARELEARVRTTSPRARGSQRLSEAGVPGGPDQRRRRGVRVRRGARARAGRARSTACAACARRCSSRDTPASARRRPPRLGEHDDELRAWLACCLGRFRHRLADRLGEHEAHVLLDDLELRDVRDAALAEVLDQALTSSSGALAPEVMPTVSTPSSQASSTCVSLSIRCDCAPCSRATSTRRFEFDELREPMTSTRSHSGAICLTAAWRFVVA